MTDNLEKLYNNYLEYTDHMVGVYGPMEVAAIMMAQALSIYRSGLTDEEYNQMVDSISASRNKVHTFKKHVVQ
jgi:hypothetical protein